MSDNGQVGIDYYEKSLGKVVLENVRANNNLQVLQDSFEGVGMKLFSSNIKMKNVEATGNGSTGISMTASDDGSNGKNGEIKVEIVGTTVVRYNGNNGILLRKGALTSLTGNMKVKGRTYIYNNRGDGLKITPGVNVDVEMARGGTLLSCGNVSGNDIFNSGGGKFDEKGVACGTQGGSGNLPDCRRRKCFPFFREKECPAP